MSAGVSKATGVFSDFFKEITAGVAVGGLAEKAFEQFGHVIGDTIMALPNAVMHSADLADHLRDLSNQTDVSVEALSQLRFVASQTGTSLEIIARTIFELGRRVAGGGDDIQETFTKIGLSLTAVKAMRPEEAFVAIFEALSRLPSAAERSAAGYEIFGQKFRMISQLSREDVHGLMEEADRLGLTISTKTADQADKFKDALDVMNHMVENVKNNIGEALIPALTDLASVAPNAGGAVLFLSQGLLGTAASLATIASGLAPALILIGNLGNTVPVLTARIWLMEAAESAAAVVTGVLSTALGAGLIIVGSAVAVVTALYQAWQLYREHAERASAETRQASIDQQTLANASKLAGHEVTSMAEAVKVLNANSASLRASVMPSKDAFAELAEATKAAKAEISNLSVAHKTELVQAMRDGVLSLDEISKKLNISTQALNLFKRETDEAAAASKKAVEEHQRAADALAKMQTPTRDVVFLQQDLAKVGKTLATETMPLLSGKALPMLGVAFNDVGQKAQTVITHTEKLSDTLRDGLYQTLLDAPKIVVDALTGGGGLLGAVEAIGSQIGAKLGSAIGTALGGKLGGAIGGSIGSLLGPLAGKLFGNNSTAGSAERVKQFNDTVKDQWWRDVTPGKNPFEDMAKSMDNLQKRVDMFNARDRFIEAAGGMEVLNQRAIEAGTTLEAIFNAQTPEEYKKAIDDLNAALDLQDEATKLLDDAVKKYGFSIDELGPKFAGQKLDEQAQGLFQDYQLLTAAGIDHNMVIEKMAPTLQTYVLAATKAGVTIPKEMEPILQSMVDQGLLTDENGKKLTDLSSLNFAETLNDKFQTLIDRISLLVDAIQRSLNPAIDGIHVAPNPFENVRIPPGFDTHGSQPDEPSYGATGGLVTRNGIVYASRGTDTIPAMLSPGERVLSVDQNHAYMNGGGVTAAMLSKLDDVYGELRLQRSLIPMAIADSLARS